MSRRVMILVYFYPPLAGGGVHRALSWTRYLPALGWDCTVVCAGEEDYWVRDASLLERTHPATEVIRVSGGSALAAWLKVRNATGGAGDQGRRAGGSFAGLRRLADFWMLPDSYLGWAKRARAAASRRLAAGGVDVLLSTSPPDSVHLAAKDLAAAHRLPWIADFRDPWVSITFRDPPTGWHRARHLSLQRSVLERADTVLAASRTHADQLAASGEVHGRVVHLPNGFEPVDPALPDEGDPDAFRIAYTGTLSLMTEAATLLEAVHDLLARRPEARRRFRVDLVGPIDTDHEDRAVALGLKGIVHFHGVRPHAETRAIQRRADLLVLWRPEGAGLRTMVPGKLYEYMDSGRPVVAIWCPGEEAAELVRRAGGVVLPPGDRAALARELETRYMAWKEAGRAPSARPEWLGEHARPALAARLAAELDRLAGESA